MLGAIRDMNNFSWGPSSETMKLLWLPERTLSWAVKAEWLSLRKGKGRGEWGVWALLTLCDDSWSFIVFITWSLNVLIIHTIKTLTHTLRWCIFIYKLCIHTMPIHKSFIKINFLVFWNKNTHTCSSVIFPFSTDSEATALSQLFFFFFFQENIFMPSTAWFNKQTGGRDTVPRDQRVVPTPPCNGRPHQGTEFSPSQEG